MMKDKVSGGLVKSAVRLVFELVLWLPAWWILTINHASDATALSLAAVLGCWIGGFVLAMTRPPWQLITTILFMIAIVAGATLLELSLLPIGIWLAAVAWRGKYAHLTPGQFGFGFGIASVGVFVATGYDDAEPYRIRLIVLAIGWLVAWLIAWNRSLVSEAGLFGSIATRAVRKESRKYALLFVAVVLTVFGLTINKAVQWLKLPRIDVNLPEPDVGQPPPVQPEEPFPIQMGEPDRSYAFWEIVEWILGIAAVFMLAWFILWMWRDRKWSWQGFKEALRNLFLRDRRAEKVPYVEERRSLAKAKRKSRLGALFHRQPRGPDWKRLNDAQKVRRLYADALNAGVSMGYPHETHLTPAESLERLERWREANADRQSGSKSAYWSWFAGIRLALLRRYEQARYSPHEVEERQVSGLLEHHPDRDKLR